MALLVQNMERLDEAVKEEADGVHNTLGKDYRCSSSLKVYDYSVLNGVCLELVVSLVIYLGI